MVIYFLISTITYLTYGSKTQEFITMNLMPLTLVTVTVKLIFCMNAFFSYPAMLLIVFQRIESHSYFDDHTTKVQRRVTVRCIITLFLAVICYSIPSFMFFANTFTGLFVTAAQFIIPPLLYMKQFKGKLSTKEIIFSYMVISIGIVGAISSFFNGILS